MIVENNIIRNSGHYGLDPHTGTHDMIIQHNIVHDNGAQGIHLFTQLLQFIN